MTPAHRLLALGAAFAACLALAAALSSGEQRATRSAGQALCEPGEFRPPDLCLADDGTWSRVTPNADVMPYRVAFGLILVIVTGVGVSLRRVEDKFFSAAPPVQRSKVKAAPKTVADVDWRLDGGGLVTDSDHRFIHFTGKQMWVRSPRRAWEPVAAKWERDADGVLVNRHADQERHVEAADFDKLWADVVAARHARPSVVARKDEVS